jgi:hypothetical protein
MQWASVDAPGQLLVGLPGCLSRLLVGHRDESVQFGVEPVEACQGSFHYLGG